MCGISGLISNKNVSNTLYESLFHLQHRGQNSYGFALCKNNEINIYKKEGLLKDYDMNLGNGTMGIGHVRYPTAGELNNNEIQPFLVNNIALCHNGTISNYQELYQLF